MYCCFFLRYGDDGQINNELIDSNTFLSLALAFNKTEDGWFIYNDTQYFVNTDELDMESARAACKKKFGDLAVITGDSERSFLWKLVRNAEHTWTYNINVHG